MYTLKAFNSKNLFSSLIVLFLIFFISSTQESQEVIDKVFMKLNLSENSFKNSEENNLLNDDLYVVEYNLNEEIDEEIRVSFCQRDNCYYHFIQTLGLAESSIKCALYELDYLNLTRFLLSKHLEDNVSLEFIVDDRYLGENSIIFLEQNGIGVFSDEERKTRYNNYMHHKFCVIDDKILLVGSMNPTENGFNYNDNNVLTIKSEKLSTNYLREFNQMLNGSFGYNKVNTLEYQNLFLNSKYEEYIVSSYFCPQNECESALIKELEKAEEEILFANFVLTLDGVEDLLLEKNSQGIEIKGVVESRMWNSKGSQVQNLSESFSIKRDLNSKTMHHKFFVVDNMTVITGSMNPSSSGVNYNDENLLVIRNENLANKFREEFMRLYIGEDFFNKSNINITLEVN